MLKTSSRSLVSLELAMRQSPVDFSVGLLVVPVPTQVHPGSEPNDVLHGPHPRAVVGGSIG